MEQKQKNKLTPKERADRRQQMMRQSERDFKQRRFAMAKALPRVQKLYLVAAGLLPESSAPKGEELVEALDVARQCIYRCRTYEALYFAAMASPWPTSTSTSQRPSATANDEREGGDGVTGGR